MPYNQIGLCFVAFVTYMIMSGFLTQTGVVLGPISLALDITITNAGSLFSFLTGGTFVGTILSMWLYSRYPIKPILLTVLMTLLVILFLLLFFGVYSSNEFSYYLACIGICCGLALSGGAVILSAIFSNEKYRASAFLATDCSFSFAGLVFPSLAAIVIATNFDWTISYAAVGILVVCALLVGSFVKFPNTKNTVKQNNKQSMFSIRVLIMAIALCVYLISQTSFLTWAPQYLETQFLLEAKQASAVVGNYWGASIFGLMTATVLVTKVATRTFLIGVSIVAVIIIWLMFITQNPQLFLLLSGILGFSSSCIFKIGISVGTLQIKSAPPILVTFLLCSATLGSTIAPVLSSFVISIFSIKSAIFLPALGYLLVASLFIACIWLEKRSNKLQAV